MPREMFQYGSKEFNLITYLLRLPPDAKVRENVLLGMGCSRLYTKLLDDGLLKKEDDEPDPLVSRTEKFFEKYEICINFEK